MTTHPEIDAYAQAVVAGVLPAGKYHRLACERHLRDAARQGTPEFPFVFRPEIADRIFAFAERVKHYKGEWAGQRVTLQPYQKFRLGSIFGWLHRDTGLRRFRTAYNELPRKNGKSLEAAIVAIYTTFFDREPGAEGYCLATKLTQAKIVFNDAKKLVRSSGLKARIGVRAANLHREQTASKLEPLSAAHEGLDGLNPHFINIDEFHAIEDRGLIDVMETATGARRQPLKFYITTAGDDPVSPCGDEHEYACKILDRVQDDETYFAFIAHADPEDDWTSLDTARKANPNYGVSVKPDDLQSLLVKATAMPASAAAYKQKRLNLWVNTEQVWLSLDDWRRGQTPWDPEELRGEPCWVGVDLASKLDLLALVFVFPPNARRAAWRFLPYVWTPADTLRERAHRDKTRYELWAEQGYLRTTPGTQVDDQVIRPVLKAERERFALQKLGVDPWHIGTLRSQLINEDGWHKEDVLDVPQTYAGMSAACKQVEASVLEALADAGGHPLMQLAVAGCVVQRDGKDNLFPVKKKSRSRIDPLVASIIGMANYLRVPVARRSKYERGGLTTVGGGPAKEAAA